VAGRAPALVRPLDPATRLLLNQVELFFSALTRPVVQHGDFTSRDDLIEMLEAYVIGHNETAKPYRWNYEGTPLKAA
jgi:hypothetical protein